ncbi:MAG TPA: phage holin family protein [Candidatus Saccharimonadales bacterium]|nr:phage holin family protein [Candidatus Saccharimonadales bacterium]
MKAVHQGFLYRFLLRWFVSGLGLWIAAGLLNGSVSYGDHFSAVVVGGLVLAIINAVLRPIIVLASVPAILLTLGLFMLVINGFTVFIASKLYHPLQISNFGVAILTGLIIGLVNYLVTAILEER